jgi:hypothetical protein
VGSCGRMSVLSRTDRQDSFPNYRRSLKSSALSVSKCYGGTVATNPLPLRRLRCALSTTHRQSTLWLSLIGPVRESTNDLTCAVYLVLTARLLIENLCNCFMPRYSRMLEGAILPISDSLGMIDRNGRFTFCCNLNLPSELAIFHKLRKRFLHISISRIEDESILP